MTAAAKKPTGKTKTERNVRIVSSMSKLALLLGQHRQTTTSWVEKRGLPWETKTPRVDGKFDYTFDLARVFEWWHDTGHEEGRLLGAKSSTPGDIPSSEGGSWTHPVTGVVITDAEVIVAQKRQIIAQANRAEHQERRELLKTLTEEEAVALVDDVKVNWRYRVMVVKAGLATVADTNRRQFEELGMNPDEARRKANAPIVDMSRYMAESSPFGDPLAEIKEDDDETDTGFVESQEAGVSDEPDGDGYDDEDGFAEDDAGDTAGAAALDGDGDRSPAGNTEPLFTDDGDPVE